MGLTIALHLLVILITIPTSNSTFTSTPTSTMSDDEPQSYRTVPVFTLKNPMWFRRFTTHCKENKLGWLMNASTGRHFRTKVAMARRASLGALVGTVAPGAGLTSARRSFGRVTVRRRGRRSATLRRNGRGGS